MDKNHKIRNAVGAKVREIRTKQGIEQKELAIACNLLGFDISRSGIGQIEMQYRQVTDIELIILSRALKKPIQDFIPKNKDLPEWQPRKVWKDE